MKINKQATSVIEAIVATLIITTGIVGMYNIYNSSVNLEANVSNNMTATAIAREGIEAMTNIRDTNWVILGSDVENCWNTLNYNTSCIMDTTFANDIPHNGHFKIYKNTNNRWMLSSENPVTSDYSDSTYRTNYRVGIDSDGFFTQTGTTTNLVPLFTREIIINYIDTSGDSINDSNDKKIEVISLVQWMDKTSTESHSVELKTILSNWKK